MANAETKSNDQPTKVIITPLEMNEPGTGEWEPIQCGCKYCVGVGDGTVYVIRCEDHDVEYVVGVARDELGL